MGFINANMARKLAESTPEERYSKTLALRPPWN